MVKRVNVESHLPAVLYCRLPGDDAPQFELPNRDKMKTVVEPLV